MSTCFLIDSKLIAVFFRCKIDLTWVFLRNEYIFVDYDF